MAQETHYIKHSLTCLHTVKHLKTHLLIVQNIPKRSKEKVLPVQVLEALVTQPSSFSSEQAT